MVVRQGEGAFSKPALQKLRLMSVESYFVNPAVATQFSSTEHEISQAHLLSPNQIQEIVMDSDSDNEKYSACEDTGDEPRPPSRQSSTSQPASLDFSASSSEDEDNVGNVAGQQTQPCLWTLPPQP
jgi:hypothetical protein